MAFGKTQGVRGWAFSARDATRQQTRRSSFSSRAVCRGRWNDGCLPRRSVPGLRPHPRNHPGPAAPRPESGTGREGSASIRRTYPDRSGISHASRGCFPLSTLPVPCTSARCLALTLRRRRVIPFFEDRLGREEVISGGTDGAGTRVWVALPAFEPGGGWDGRNGMRVFSPHCRGYRGLPMVRGRRK